MKRYASRTVGRVRARVSFPTQSFRPGLYGSTVEDIIIEGPAAMEETVKMAAITAADRKRDNDDDDDDDGDMTNAADKH